jgi:phage baseplate assembly protein W
MSGLADQPLRTTRYLAFPLRIGSEPARSDRAAHVHEQIEQVLLTSPGERVMRPAFGAGVRALVFEPNGSALHQLAVQRLRASLSAALAGEVDPSSLRIGVNSGDAQVEITIAYTLTTIGQAQQHTFVLAGGSGG